MKNQMHHDAMDVEFPAKTCSPAVLVYLMVVTYGTMLGLGAGWLIWG